MYYGKSDQLLLIKWPMIKTLQIVTLKTYQVSPQVRHLEIAMREIFSEEIVESRTEVDFEKIEDNPIFK